MAVGQLRRACSRPGCPGMTEGRFCETHRGRAVVVCGPPCSGKSTYVEERRQPGDIVFDFDQVMRCITGLGPHEKPEDCIRVVLAMREALLGEIALGSLQRATWIITTWPAEAEEMARLVNGEVVILATPIDTCLQRLRSDPDRPTHTHGGFEATIRRWHVRAGVALQ